MIVEVDEILDRFVAQLSTLDGYGASDDPFDPGAEPAERATRVFSVTAPSTTFRGNRQQPMEPCDVTTRIVVIVESPVGLAGPERAATYRRELRAEGPLRRRLLSRGESWTYGLRITWQGASRQMLDDDMNQWLRTEYAFDVGHLVQV